ncbi:hypothetical protein SAMN02745166_05167 [Prosthecobacter debontii]|uniref:Uncharacterized protein n=1 Tax=Prosthecobacter debontii TaxID=48467 RepID=A0A1T4Z6K5_9BACT|nr:hypothetical protein SAMN02745166_05167 [Prosthecobacter debontii]
MKSFLKMKSPILKKYNIHVTPFIFVSQKINERVGVLPQAPLHEVKHSKFFTAVAKKSTLIYFFN